MIDYTNMSFSLLQDNNHSLYTRKIKERKFGRWTLDWGTLVWPMSVRKEFHSVPLSMDWVTRQVYHTEPNAWSNVLFFIPVEHPVYIGFLVHQSYIHSL